jgi:hypothetical protein
MMPAELKMQLEMRAHVLGVTIVGVHSVCLVDDDTMDIIFDVTPDECGCGLHIVFPLPPMVSKDDLRAFVEWLAHRDEMTVH